MSITDNFNIKFTGKFDCPCSYPISKTNFESSITPKSVTLKCLNCNRVYFYRQIALGVNKVI